MLAAANAHYLRQQRIAGVTVTALRRVWAKVDSGNFDATWNVTRATALVAAAQRAAAGDADSYVDEALGEQNASTDRAGTVNAAALSAMASDGRPLSTLLQGPRVRAKRAVAVGRSADEALRAGQALLDMIAATQVQDAGRVATGVATVARPAAIGWVRMLNPPSCSRCAVLAGRVYKVNQGFQRHPFATAGMCRRPSRRQATSPQTPAATSTR